jgi:hypothetical protein
MDLIEDIGPILGIVAFLGFAVLALLIVLQAREVRRLREWAGRAPERAFEADEATQAAAEEAGESEPEPGRFASARARMASSFGERWAELDRRSPVDPRWFLGVLAAGLIAAIVVTSGFGLFGGEDTGGGGGGGGAKEREKPAEVAVLNGTQIDDPVAPVAAVTGMADAVANQVVEPAGFKVAEKGDAPEGFDLTVIMFEAGAEDDAEKLAKKVADDLGETPVEAMTPDIQDVAGKAALALVIGQDDAGFGGLQSDTTVVP